MTKIKIYKIQPYLFIDKNFYIYLVILFITKIIFEKCHFNKKKWIKIQSNLFFYLLIKTKINKMSLFYLLNKIEINKMPPFYLFINKNKIKKCHYFIDLLTKI